MSKEKYFSLETFNNCRSVMLTDIDKFVLFSGLFRRDLEPTRVLWDKSDEFWLPSQLLKTKETIYNKSLTEPIELFFQLFLCLRCFTSKLKILLFSFYTGRLFILPAAPHIYITQTTADPKSSMEKIFNNTESDPEYVCTLKTLQKLPQLHRLNGYESEFIWTK